MWWDLSSKFMVCKIHKLSSISLEFGSLGSLRCALCLCKKQTNWMGGELASKQTTLQLINWKYFMFCIHLLSRMFFFGEFYISHSIFMFTCKFLWSHNSKRVCWRGKLEAVIQNSVSLVSAETWQRLESVLGMPNLVALGQTLILNAWHTSLCVSIKPCLWIPCKPGNRFYATHVLAFSAS